MITALDPKTALVLIDLQKGIVQYPTVHPVTEVLANAAKLVAAFRKAGLPVVVVNVDPAKATPVQTRKDAGARRNAFSAELLEIVPEIVTSPDDIYITKQTWSAFYETPLHSELLKGNITGIVLAGIATSLGVEGTARAAAERGYNIAFAKDAMTDIVASAHENSLQVIFPRIGEVGYTDDIIAKL